MSAREPFQHPQSIITMHTQLEKRSPSEADPEYILESLHFFADGAQESTVGHSRAQILAMASNWHLEQFLADVEDAQVDDMPFLEQVAQVLYSRTCEERLAAATWPATAQPTDLQTQAREIGERIKAFKRNLRLVALEYVEIGRQLMQLKEALSMGASGATRIGANYGHGGWQALCESHVGISYKTADRYIADADAYRVLRDASEANPRMRDYLEAVESGQMRAAKALLAAENWESATPREIDPDAWKSLHQTLDPGTPKVWLREMEEAALKGDELAAIALERAARGEVRMGAAYAGWLGGEAVKGKTRRDPDPARIMVRASISLNKYWAKLHELDIERRRAVTDTWLALMSDETMPAELALESYRILRERLGK